MTLRTWIAETGTTIRDVADRLNVTIQSVYGWMSGTQNPSFVKLVEIERLTDGAVTAATLRDEPTPESRDTDPV